MMVPDVNLLLYAYDSGSPFHDRAARWWTACLAGSEPVGLALPVVLGFVRLTTMSKVFRSPLTPGEAGALVRSWLDQPVASILEPPASHVTDVLVLLDEVGTGGNLVTDAQLAALAIAHRAVLYTTDADFLRFPGLRWVNPITGHRG